MDFSRILKSASGKGLWLLSLLISVFLLVACSDDPTPTSSLTLPSTTAAVTSNPTATVASTQPSTPVPSATIQATSPASATSGVSSATATNLPQPPATATIASSPTPASTRNFDRVFIIVLENADYTRAVAQPYLAKLAGQGAFLNNFYAVTHPSYPNYLAMVAGSTFGITSDGQTDLAQTSLVDLMEAKGVSWKSYAEQYPATSGCFKGVISNGYVRKHEPFLSFTNVQKDPNLCSKIVPASQLQKDLAAGGGGLPAYSLYVPDLNNDGHDTGVNYAAKWLEGFLTPLMQNPAFSQRTLVVITFDEGDSGGTNQIYTLLLGDPVKAGVKNNTKYNHYSLLRTIEDNFSLGNLGREDAKATPISGVWNTPPAR